MTRQVDRGGVNFDLAIISSQNTFYQRMKMLEAQGVPRNLIIDGRVFYVPNLDFPRFLKEGVAYGVVTELPVRLNTSIYKRIYFIGGSVFVLDRKSAISRFTNDGGGLVSIGQYSSVSWNIIFEMGLNGNHSHRLLTTAPLEQLEWSSPAKFYPSQEQCKIFIGNDVWIGRGCFLKCSNPNKPLIIGDGAVIASDSVVVKNVPPYAIVGGNPAQIIKYRFPPHVIEALLRIKWWDWSLDKIHDNFKYFNDIEKFIALHDRS